MIYNNYFETGNQFAIWLVNHNADPLDNIVIAYNTFVNSGEIRLGGEGNFPPQRVVLANNLLHFPNNSFLSDLTGNEIFANNAVEGSAKYSNYKGFMGLNSYLTKNESGYFQPGIVDCKGFRVKNGLDLNILDVPGLDDDPNIVLDIMNQDRLKNKGNNCYGCSILNGEKNVHPYATQENTGPTYLKSHK